MELDMPSRWLWLWLLHWEFVSREETQTLHGNAFLLLLWVLCGLPSFKMFSNCSKQSIYKTIESKAQECFQERSNKVCGNSRVDEGEECDPGIMYLNNDTCCSSECMLKEGVQCRWAHVAVGEEQLEDAGALESWKGVCARLHVCLSFLSFTERKMLSGEQFDFMLQNL